MRRCTVRFACASCIGLVACATPAATGNVDVPPELAGGSAGVADAAGGTRGASEASAEFLAGNVRARCETSTVEPPMLRRLTRRELEHSVRDVFPELGAAWLGPTLGPDPVSEHGFTNSASELLVGPQTAERILTTAKEVASLLVDPAVLPAVLPCAAQGGDATCAATFIDTYGPRLYRRPLTAEERSELIDYNQTVSARSDFTTGIKWTVVELLQAPEFLYRSEIGDAQGTLDQYEVATELAYTFGGSTPGPELLMKAERGELNTEDALEEEARVLLATPAGRDALLEFFREWSGYERVLGKAKAAEALFLQDQAPAMVEETRRFFDDVVVTNDGTVADLLTTSTTQVDPTLATFYGFGDVSDGFSAAVRPEGQGIGLLAQASLLAGRSHYEHSSPVFRGLFVYSQLLCGEPIERPAVVPSLEEAAPANTTRERYEIAHAQGACATCHRRFDPFGFALEHYDATGRYRELDNGYPIDTHAVVDFEGTSLDIDGLEDLAAQLASLPQVSNCVSGRMAEYVFGGAGGRVCLAEDARAALENGDVGLRELYVRLAGAPSFMHRVQ